MCGKGYICIYTTISIYIYIYMPRPNQSQYARVAVLSVKLVQHVCVPAACLVAAMSSSSAVPSAEAGSSSADHVVDLQMLASSMAGAAEKRACRTAQYIVTELMKDLPTLYSTGVRFPYSISFL